ncbi:MAG: DUF481 domain-containing protein [Planctomycetes bacterium]|nr:DUF481 domain-containing protein [Planctomycetota bacterium]
MLRTTLVSSAYLVSLLSTATLHAQTRAPGTDAAPSIAAATPRSSTLDNTPLSQPIPVETGANEWSSVLQDPPPKEKDGWKSSINIGGLLVTGNTRRRAASAAADAVRRQGPHRTTLGFNWSYAETQSPTDARYMLDQRYLNGSAKQDYFLSANQKDYVFAALQLQYDWARNIELRRVITAGYGRQLIDEKTMQWSLEVGLGHYEESVRIQPAAPAPNQDTDYFAARVGSEFSWTVNETWTLLNSLSYIPSLEKGDDFYGRSDTRLRAKLGKGQFFQLQWILDYDNTPVLLPAVPPATTGVKADRSDHQFLLSFGWEF